MKNNIFLFKILIIITFTFCFCCSNSNDKKLSLYLENKEQENSYSFYDSFEFEQQVIKLLAESIKEKKIIDSEWNSVQQLIYNLSYKISNNMYGTSFIIDTGGNILVHKNKQFENTNINKYTDYKNGLYMALKNEHLNFFYKNKIYSNAFKKKMRCHVSVYPIEELNIILITLNPYL